MSKPSITAIHHAISLKGKSPEFYRTPGMQGVNRLAQNFYQCIKGEDYNSRVLESI